MKGPGTSGQGLFFRQGKQIQSQTESHSLPASFSKTSKPEGLGLGLAAAFALACCVLAGDLDPLQKWGPRQPGRGLPGRGPARGFSDPHAHPNAPVIEYVPSLVVFTRKQGTGRRRARICACGNFISSTAATEYEGPRSLSRHSLYAPGLDSTTFRCQVRHAAHMVWIIAGLDISKAFLTAPMNRAQREGRLVVVQPPEIGSLHKRGAVDCEEGLVRFGRKSCSMGGVARPTSSRHVLGVKGWTSNELSEVQCRPKSAPYYGTREAGRCKQVGRDNGG